MGQATEPGDHEVRDILGIAFGMDAIEIPTPLALVVIEREQPFFGERAQKLDQKKRIATGLVVHQLRQRCRVFRLATKCIRGEPAHAIGSEGRQSDFLHARSRAANDVECSCQRMGGIDFIVAVGTNQQQMPEIGPGQHILKQFQRRRI